jgi:PPE-repeat protein
VVLGWSRAGKSDRDERSARGVGSARRHTGTRNAGTRNTGIRNSGTRNTGTRNTGIRNTGTRNTGTRNTGTRNAGIRDAGIRHAGTSDADCDGRTRDAARDASTDGGEIRWRGLCALGNTDRRGHRLGGRWPLRRESRSELFG